MDQVEALVEAGRNGELNGSVGHSRAGSDSSPRRARSERTRSPDSRSSRHHDDRRDRDRKRRYHDSHDSDYRRRTSRSPPYSRRRADSRDRDYDRRRSYDRDRDYYERDRDYDRRRRRSPSPVPRDRDSRRDGPRSPYRDSPPRHRRDRERDRDRDAPRRRRSPSPGGRAASREPSQEIDEAEREMRTVFVSQLSNRVDDRILANFFENVAQVGPVREAKVIVDRISKRSKGVGYVEFKEAGFVSKAIQVTGTKLLGIPIKAEYTESEKNRMALASNTPSALQIPIGPGSDAHPNSAIPYNRLYIGSLNFNLGEKDLREVFEPFGTIDFCALHMDEGTGKSKGYGYVQFKKLADAKVAFEKMNGFSLAGRQLQIRVGLSNEKGSAANTFNHRNDATLDEGGGAPMNQMTRLDLMNKLARGHSDLAPTQAPLTRVNVPMAVTSIVLLKNMWSEEDAAQRNFDVELAEDIKSEVESKYGATSDIFVDKDSQDGEVYVKFKDINDAVRAHEGLNGRFFGGAKISASHVSDAILQAAAGSRRK